MSRPLWAWAFPLALVAIACSDESGTPSSTRPRLDLGPALAPPDPAPIAPGTSKRRKSRPDETADRAAHPVPPGFRPRLPVKGAPRPREELAPLLAAALEVIPSLAAGDAALLTGEVVAALGPGDPAAALAALERAEASIDSLPEAERWPARAGLVRGAIALLPEAGGPFLEKVLALREKDALAPGEAGVPRALLQALEPQRAPIQERVKISTYVLTQVGRIRSQASRRELLVGLAARMPSLGGQVGCVFLDQILQRAPLALQPVDRVEVRLRVAEALGELGSAGEPLDGEVLQRLAGEARELDVDAERYSYLDSLSIAAGGLAPREAAALLVRLEAEAPGIGDPTYRRWALRSALLAWGRLAASDPSGAADHLAAFRRLAATWTDPGERARVLAPAVDELVADLPGEAVALLCECIEVPGSSRAKALESTASVALRIDPAAAAPYWTRLRLRAADPDALEWPALVHVGLARADREEAAAFLARAVDACRRPDVADPARVALEIARAARDLLPTGAVGVFDPLLSAAWEGPDPARGSALAGAVARALAWVGSEGVGPAARAAVELAARIEEPARRRDRLVELARGAIELPPLEAEATLLAIAGSSTEADGPEAALALRLWAADSLVAVGSPRATELLAGAIDGLDERSPSVVLSNVARLASLAGPPASEDAGRRFDGLLEASGSLEVRLAIATGYLAGDERAGGGRIESALVGVDPAAAAGLGEVASRLDGRRVLALSRSIADPRARLAFLASASGE